MKENEDKLHEILQLLNSLNLLKDFILIGSWALFMYQFYYNYFEVEPRTIDIDFFIPNTKNIKCQNFIKGLNGINYDLFNDFITNKSYIISPDGFEIEFLTKLNRDRTSCIKIGDTGLYAESLSYLDIFEDDYIVVRYKEQNVRVASPCSFLLQKLLIIDQRNSKIEKDYYSILHLMSTIFSKELYRKELLKKYLSLPKKWRNKIKNNCEKYKIKFPL